MSDTQQSLAETPDWQLFRQARARQKTAGLLAALFLILAFAVLVDGLVSHMRGGGSFRLEMLAGTTEALSGPLGSANPVASDMQAYPIPVDAPLVFEFKGFFSSYWFGSGMWRGEVHVLETAPSGVYALAVGVDGNAASTFQTYTISVARSIEEQNAASLSFIRRTFSCNPFVLAALFAALGFGIAFAAIMLGRRCNQLLSDLGLAEIVKVVPEENFLRLYCITGKRETPTKNLVAYDPELKRLGKVIYDRAKSGISECLFVCDKDVSVPSKGSFVAFWEPKAFQGTPMRRTIFLRQKSTEQDMAAPEQEAKSSVDAPAKNTEQ